MARRGSTSEAFIAAAVLVVVAVAGGCGGRAGEAVCDQAAIIADFDGTVTSKTEVEDLGDVLAYRVIRVRVDDDGLVPPPGESLAVGYEEGARVLEVGGEYRVRAWGGGSEGLGSQIEHESTGGCDRGVGTSAVDGSFLGSPGVDRFWPLLVAALAAAGALTAAFSLVTRRRGDASG